MEACPSCVTATDWPPATHLCRPSTWTWRWPRSVELLVAGWGLVMRSLDDVSCAADAAYDDHQDQAGDRNGRRRVSITLAIIMFHQWIVLTT